MRTSQNIMFVTGLETIWKADIMFETNLHYFITESRCTQIFIER